MRQTIIKSVQILMPGDDWEIVAGETVIDGRTVMGIEHAGAGANARVGQMVESDASLLAQYSSVLRAYDETGNTLCFFKDTTPHICYCETIEVD